MAKRERFGKFVLLEEVSTSGLGTEYRAAKLAGAALERLVSLIRVTPALSANADFAKHLMEQAKAAARLQSPNVLRLVAIGGPVGGSLYLAYEHVESKSLKAILERSRRDGFPFAADQALLITSKLCAALEYAHSKKAEGGRQIHGFINPEAVLVTHDGDIKVRGFGTWGAGIREASGIAGDEALYLSPEQLAGGGADGKSDLFAAGTLLFEMLTGQPLFSYSGGRDVAARLKSAKLASSSDDSLPKAMLDILSRALAPAPSDRFADMAEMHRVLDALMFSGEFNPTTFNLAFFMHSLFREEIEREAQAVAEEKAASYAEFAEDAQKAAAPARAAAAPTPVAAPAAAPVPAPQPPAASARSAEIEIRIPPVKEDTHPPRGKEDTHPPRAKEDTHPPRAKEHATPAEGVAAHPAVSAREAAAGLTFHKEEPRRGGAAVAGIGVVVVIAAIAGWYFGLGPGAKKAAPAPPPATLSAEAAAAVARVKELEEKLKRFEQEKADAEAKAAEDAKKKVEAQAAAKGQTVDPAVLLKAQEEARRKAQAEQEKRQQEERRRLEEEKRAEEARVQEEKRRADALAAAAAAAATPPPTLAPVTQPPVTAPPVTAPPVTEPAIKPGALVNLNDLGVIAPVVERQAALQYPAFALQQRAEGVVELNVLIDERGNVLDAKVVKGAAGLGLNQAAIDNVKRRKYRPATKDGVPVRVYMTVMVRFELPR
jgi:TonB family protein